MTSGNFTRNLAESFPDWAECFPNRETAATSVYRRSTPLQLAGRPSFANIAWQATRQPVPLQVVPEKYRDSFQYNEFREGIAKANSFIRDKKDAFVQRPELIFALQGKMYPDMDCHGVWGEISGIEFEQLVSAVKNRILDFCLKIEAENPEAGEALPNTQPVPQEKVQQLVNNYFAPVGNVAQHSQGFCQTADITVEHHDLSRLVTEFSNRLDELRLDAPQKRRAEAQIATLRAQLTDEPDPVIVNQAGRTLRNITEGAIGSLLAAAVQPSVWQWIQQAMARFN